MISLEETRRIPSEIYQFFMNPGGHSLILRGNAGTGKTTFALQTIEDLAQIENSFYFSMRVSDHSLITQFPWLTEKLMPACGTANQKKEDVVGKHRTGLNKLKGLGTQSLGTAKREMSVMIGKDLGDLEHVYDVVEGSFPARSLIIIDSIDAMAERYSMSCAALITAIQKDLVEGYGSNVLFVLENNETQLDYLGDGVIILGLADYQLRRMREINILKLRGCEIAQPKYLFTLKTSRIQTFANLWENEVILQDLWKPVQDTTGKISFGITDLDRLMRGGMERGSLTLIELGYSIPTAISGMLEKAIVANFVSMKRGVFWLPTRKTSAEAAKNQMVGMLSKEQFEKNVRIPELAAQMEVTGAPYIMPVEGSSPASDYKWKSISYALGNTESPLLSIIGFDSLESIYGDKVMDQIPDHLAAIKRNNGIFVGITSPSTKSTQRLADLANLHIKVERIGGTVVLFGEEPYTECNALAIETRERGGNISLTPIV
jgi:KaiC/GvpD/RAD55 family RecA-like ATPase